MIDGLVGDVFRVCAKFGLFDCWSDCLLVCSSLGGFSDFLRVYLFIHI